MTATLPDDVDDLHPSAVFVYVLENADGSVSRKEFLEQMELPERTIDDTLARLEAHSIVRRDRTSEDLGFASIMLTESDEVIIREDSHAGD